ncbi:unnamed protein product [Lactuca saligna]|uniref:Uncharacterized protein n=1 Tax=Lactuca saligna TaxID=75948 RepID=A0AA36EDN9_LACSI|nr:unnamed protein product [Lactuca saligna]
MTGWVEAEVDPQKQIIVVDIPYSDATTDQSIPDTVVVPLNVVYPSSCFEGEISQEDPQGIDNYIDSDNVQLDPRKRKASFSGGAYDDEAGSSFAAAAGDLSASPPKTKRKLIFDLNELLETRILPIKVKKIFKNDMEKQHIVSYLNDRIDRRNFRDVLTRRSKPDRIIILICTKARNESLKLHLVRKKTKYEYNEVFYAHELVKFGYNKWIQIQEIIDKYKGVHAQEVKL